MNEPQMRVGSINILFDSSEIVVQWDVSLGCVSLSGDVGAPGDRWVGPPPRIIRPFL